jgi:hypothetical protein
VIRHASHANRPAGRTAACGERDVEQAGGLLRVVEEEFVEVPHAVEQQHVRMLRLDAQVLLHHGRVLTQTGVVQDFLFTGHSERKQLYS